MEILGVATCPLPPRFPRGIIWTVASSSLTLALRSSRLRPNTTHLFELLLKRLDNFLHLQSVGDQLCVLLLVLLYHRSEGSGFIVCTSNGRENASSGYSVDRDGKLFRHDRTLSTRESEPEIKSRLLRRDFYLLSRLRPRSGRHWRFAGNSCHLPDELPGAAFLLQHDLSLCMQLVEACGKPAHESVGHPGPLDDFTIYHDLPIRTGVQVRPVEKNRRCRPGSSSTWRLPSNSFGGG